METRDGDDEPNVRPLSRHPMPSAASLPPPRHTHAISEETYEVIVPTSVDLLCFSNQRWEGPSPRPQQLMSRLCKQRRVFFIEKGHVGGVPRDCMQLTCHGGVTVLTPLLADGLHAINNDHRIRLLLNDAMRTYAITDYMLWYYSPSAMGFTRHLFPRLVVWDCIEEMLDGEPHAVSEREAQLLAWTDLVFTGGHSLQQAKRQLHPHVSTLPSAIDTAHFQKARRPQSDPCDQAAIEHPRIGCHLALDDRCDLDLVDQCARLRPEWQWIMVGPLLPNMANRLPQAKNIHYLGSKDLSQLPYYMSGWDAGFVPLICDDRTRFSNPAEIAELLAAGRPTVATAIADVQHVFGDDGLVLIAERAREFILALERAMVENGDLWRSAVDSHLLENSWDGSCERIQSLIEAALAGKQSSRLASAIHAATRRDETSSNP